jgi:hypothetical protein
VKLQHLTLRNLGSSMLIEVNETGNTITLENENGDNFFIDKSTKKVSVRNAALITSDNDYEI